MIKIDENVTIENIELESSSYSKRIINASIKITNSEKRNYITLTIQGNNFSCGINFISGLDYLAQILKYYSKKEDIFLNIIHKIVKYLNKNSGKFAGFAAHNVPGMYLVSTNDNEYNSYHDSLKCFAFEEKLFEPFCHNENSGKSINLMILDSEKILTHKKEVKKNNNQDEKEN